MERSIKYQKFDLIKTASDFEDIIKIPLASAFFFGTFNDPLKEGFDFAGTEAFVAGMEGFAFS